MTKEELDEVKSLVFDYIFPKAAYKVIEELEIELVAKEVLDIARRCFSVCQDFAKELIDKELEKIGED